MNLNNQPVIKDKSAVYTVEDYNLASYQDIINIRTLAHYDVTGNQITFPANYLDDHSYDQASLPLSPTDGLFDYQQVIVKVAYLKERYAIFADAGLGKTMIMGELARQIHAAHDGRIIFCLPLNIMHQFEEMMVDFFPDFPEFEHMHRSKTTLTEWCHYGDTRIVFVNHDVFINKHTLKNVDAFFMDESSILKGGIGGNGKIAQNIIKATKGIRYKYAASATPSPNDRTEYAMHALFLELVRAEKEFYHQFFVNKDGQYVLRKHAHAAFYKYLSSFSIFIRNPKSYGFEDNLAGLKPWQEIHKSVKMTKEQDDLIRLYATKGRQQLLPNTAFKPGNLKQRGKFSQISKGFIYNDDKSVTYIDSNKPQAIVDIVKGHDPEQVIIWVVFDSEGDIIYEHLQEAGIEAVHITGKTHTDDRVNLIEDFRHNKLRVIISKPRILGFGLNLQYCRIAVFSGLNDCYDEETEVLTKRGWLKFEHVDDHDKVATVNPDTLLMEWQKPTRIINENYQGEMIRFYSDNGFDLLVTPNHKLFVQRCPIRYKTSNGNWELKYAKELQANYKRQEYRMMSCPDGFKPDYLDVKTAFNDNGSIDIPVPDDIRINSRTRIVKEINPFDFMKLVGWYLSEGHCRPKRTREFGRITISQSKQNMSYRNEIIELMGSLDLSVNAKTKDVQSYSRQLASFLIDNFGNGSRNKKIPKWVKNIPQEFLLILRDTMMKGDGNKAGTCYRTSSERLADDFQEICIKTGVRANKRLRLDRGKYIWDITLACKYTKPTVHNEPTIEFYQGKIGCVTVPNHTIIVRRNGTPIISGNSYEQFYQAVKRIHRYGQDKQCLIYHVYTSYEESILFNVLGKKEEMDLDFAYQEKLYIQSLYDELQEFLKLENYQPLKEQKLMLQPVMTENYEIYHDDSIKAMLSIKETGIYGKSLFKNSVDFSVFSPPFMGDIFTYTDDPADMGNTRGAGAEGGLDEYMLQFRFFLEGMKIVTKPGRIMAVHLEDVPLRKGMDGHIGIFDFVGESIRQANKAGWILVAKVPILKNQQMQAITKRVSSLTMTNMETDRIRIAPATNGYLCLFKKPGENLVRVSDLARCLDCQWQGYADNLRGYDERVKRGYKSGDIFMFEFFCPECNSDRTEIFTEMDGNKWIIYAEGIWPEHKSMNQEFDKISKMSQEQRWLDLTYTALGIWPDIRETDVLYHGNKDQEDADKHLCPLPRAVARRAIELYTNPGETVFTPFAGIGTEIDAALRLNRKAIGIELKPEYMMQAVKNADLAIQETQQLTLWDFAALSA